MTPRARIAIIAIAAVGLVLAFFAARGSDDQDEPPPTPTAQTTTQDAATQTATTPATTAPEEEDDGEPTATTGTPPAAARVPVVEVKDGEVVDGVAKLEFDKGDKVAFLVASDVNDEVHVHGYDITREVPAGGRVRISFTAKIDGRFEVELENAGLEIARLDIQP